VRSSAGGRSRTVADGISRLWAEQQVLYGDLCHLLASLLGRAAQVRHDRNIGLQQQRVVTRQWLGISRLYRPGKVEKGWGKPYR